MVISKTTQSSQSLLPFGMNSSALRVEKKDLIDPNNTRRYYYNYNLPRFVFGGGWQVLTEYNGSGVFKQWYAYGNYIDEVLAKGTTPWPVSTMFYIHDHLYSPAALTDFWGTVLERYEYDAYGSPTIWNAGFTTERDSSNYGNPYYFQGKRLDLLDSGSLELMFWPYRNYSTYLGRWYQHDKLGMIPNDNKEINQFAVLKQYNDGLNLYGSFSSNPLVYLDIRGLNKCPCTCGPVVDEFLLSAAKRMFNRADKLPASEKGILDGTLFLVRNGESMNLVFMTPVGCPKNEACMRTVMLCGVCLHNTQVHNMVYGIMANLVRVPRLIRNALADLHECLRHGHFETNIQRGSYDVGNDIANARPSTVVEMCSAIKPKNIAAASAFGKYKQCKKCPNPSPGIGLMDFSKVPWKLRWGQQVGYNGL